MYINKKERGGDGKFIKGSTPWNKCRRIPLNIDFIKKRYFDDEMSTIEIGKELKVNDRTIYNRLKEAGFKLRDKTNPPKRICQKIKQTMIKRGIRPKEIYSGVRWNKGLKNSQVPWNKGTEGLQISTKKGKNFDEFYGEEKAKEIISKIKEKRKTQITPVKDTKIELKLQEFLKQLGIEFFTHKYIKEIEHGYQCDILIPVQKGIAKKTIIEAYGDYWHKIPNGREIDVIRVNELKDAGWRVLVFWESEIKPMQLNDLKIKL